MKAWILMGLLVVLGRPAIAAEDTAAPVSGPAASALSSSALVLTGRWGIGFDSIPGASAGTGLVPGLTAANALAVRYWVNENFCWDGLASVNLNSQPPGGAGATGVPAGTDQRAWGVGTVMKFNLKRPSRWVLVQTLGRASFASLQQVSNNGSGGSNASAVGVGAGVSGQTTTTFALGAGLGFEAFLPFWDALSVEGNIIASFSSSQTKVEGSAGAQSGSSLSIDAGGFTPLNVGIHLYF